MAQLSVSTHLLIEDQDLDLSASLAPFDSNGFMLYPWAKSFFQKLCPAAFPPVTVHLNINGASANAHSPETEVLFSGLITLLVEAMQKEEIWGEEDAVLPPPHSLSTLCYTHILALTQEGKVTPACHLSGLHQPGGRKKRASGTPPPQLLFTQNKRVSLSHPTPVHQPK